jgi:hypothetical protein
VALRTCQVSCRDLKGIEHAVEITADSLYEAVARRLHEARAMLAEIYNWFTEGFDTPI